MIHEVSNETQTIQVQILKLMSIIQSAQAQLSEQSSSDNDSVFPYLNLLTIIDSFLSMIPIFFFLTNYAKQNHVESKFFLINKVILVFYKRTLLTLSAFSIIGYDMLFLSVSRTVSFFKWP